MSDKIGMVNRSVEETGMASQQVLAAAKDLARQSDQMSREVAEFLKSIRAQ
ncbi:MAG: hypothetical protein WDO70_08135 [Alphaproteobacteria bacterium]